ncbi:MAG: polyphosphate kinase 1 [Chitinophagales bacterium]
MIHSKRFINRDLSWLSFNERVLQEAADQSVPLLERLKFLGIFSSNLDEFFRVRVATLRRVMQLGKTAKQTLHVKPTKLLDEIQQRVILLNKRFDEIYVTILEALQKHKIYIVDETQLNKTQGQFVNDFFSDQVRPALVPLMLNQVHQFPYLKDRAIYLAIKLSVTGKPKATQYALVEVPTDQISRFLILPGAQSKKQLILLDDVIRYNLAELFSIFSFDKIEAYTVKMTRDAELDIDTDISQGLMEKISRSVKKRQKGAPVRFVYDKNIPEDLLQLFRSKLKLQKYDNLIAGGRYHNFRDFINFPDLQIPELTEPPLQPLQHPAFQGRRSMFDVIAERDVMLHYPYHSFNQFIELLREAAMDPCVRTIKMTMYRAARRSKVVNALINAARNGKHVLVVVELQARFDEEANIKWAKTLADEGIQVVYGVPGLKVHSKLCSIGRLENGKLRYYANLSTGNFNEMTSQTYCDETLFTVEKHITTEVNHVFDFFERNYQVKSFKYLIPSPLRTRKKLLQLIDNEVVQAKKRKAASIFLKLNSLADEELIEALYTASNAGVKIKIIIRGICALIPGVSGMSENIEVVSIIDKYLEHSRIFVFHNAGEPLYYFSSADWMMRNLDTRVEISCPVLDVKIQKEIQDLLDIQWADNVKARQLPDNVYRRDSKERIRAQDRYYQYLRKQKGGKS